MVSWDGSGDYYNATDTEDKQTAGSRVTMVTIQLLGETVLIIFVVVLAMIR